ncbi:MAG: MmcQ/YjbR family DNA-binding protein [Ferruginibacter sp.]
MVSTLKARELLAALPDVTEKPHFNLSSFRVNNKIFSTLWEADKKLMVKLSLVEQSIFCSIDPKNIYPVPGGWGKQGATFIKLAQVKKDVVIHALQCAWKNSASKTMLKKYRSILSLK